MKLELMQALRPVKRKEERGRPAFALNEVGTYVSASAGKEERGWLTTRVSLLVPHLSSPDMKQCISDVDHCGIGMTDNITADFRFYILDSGLIRIGYRPEDFSLINIHT